MNLEGGPDGYAVVMPDGNFVGIWRERDIAEKIANRGRMSKDERIVPVYFDVPVAAAPEARAQITRITIPPDCNATGQIFMTMKLSAGEWYCHGCGANQSEPACRFRKSVPL